MTLREHPDEIMSKSNSPLVAINPSWKRVRLGDIAFVRNGCAFESSQFSRNAGMPLIRIRDVGKSSTDTRYHGAFRDEDLVDPGSIVVGMDGDFRVARWTGERALLNQRVCKIAVRNSSTYDERLLLYALPGYLDEVHRRTSATTVKHLSSITVEDLPIPLPPIAEQHRIVAAIEEQLSRLDDAVGLIESALRRLPLIRRAVLAEVMPEPLPAGWKLLTVEEAGTVELGRQRSPKYHTGPNMKPYLRVANVHEDRIDLRDVKEMDFPPEHLARHELRPGDILLNEGQSPEFVGRPAMYRGEMPGVCFTNSLIRFRPFDFVNGEYALLVFLRHLLFGRFQREAQITTNIAHMAAGRLKRVEFPVPPLDEQHDIVEEARRQLSLLDAFGMELRTALRRSDSLRRAILAAAFRGELVPQDPADEPAADLLARIASERPAPTPRTRRKNGA